MSYQLALRRVTGLRVNCFLVAVISICSFRLAMGQDPRDLACVNKFPAKTLCKFVDELTVPELVDTSDGKLVDIGAYKIKQKLHRDLPPTTLYAYGLSKEKASAPGPTLIAKKNHKTTIRWSNHIEDASLCASEELCLPVDKSVNWANPKGGVPTVVHVHGAMVPSVYDGHPDAWFTSEKFGHVGMAYANNTYEYLNEQDATGLWYHDHTMGITRLTVFAGLAGMYLIKDAAKSERHLTTLPQGTLEVPLILEDKQFRSDGSLSFPGHGDNEEVHPHWQPEYFGEHVMVNGKVWPYMNVEPTMYRFRVLDAADARFFTLKFWLVDPATQKPVRLLRFQIIGSDQGYLNRAVTASSHRLGPGERAHILIDFSTLPLGSTVLLRNHAKAPFPGGDDTNEDTSKVMKFLINRVRRADAVPSRVPAILNRLLAPKPLAAVNSGLGRLITLTEMESEKTGNPLNSFIEGRPWELPTTIWPRSGTTEIWTIINFTVDMHPIHIHLVPHRVLSRQRFKRHLYNQNKCSFSDGSCLAGKPIPPPEYESGWEDTTQSPPGYVTKLLMHFGKANGKRFSFDPTIGPGYVIHCHILAHEDNVMMRRFELLPEL